SRAAARAVRQRCGQSDGPVTGGRGGAALVAEAAAIGRIADALPAQRPGRIDADAEVGAGAVALGGGIPEVQRGEEGGCQATGQPLQRLAPRQAAGQVAREGIEVEGWLLEKAGTADQPPQRLPPG